MATQRIVSKEKTYLDDDGKGAPEPSNITPAVPSSVIWKLLTCTFAMVTLPLGTYFFVVNFVLIGNTTAAGALAAVMANVVLIAYVVMAYQDDLGEQQEEQRKEKKTS